MPKTAVKYLLCPQSKIKIEFLMYIKYLEHHIALGPNHFWMSWFWCVMNAMSNLIRVMDNIPLEAESAFYTVLLLSSQVKSVVKRLCIN